MTSPARTLARRVLPRRRVIARGPGHSAAVALTFDDGPSLWTMDIAAALESHGCRATFFLLGAAVQAHPEIAAALAGAGHELGNHLWSHADPERQSASAIRAEIDRTADAIAAASGIRPALVRPPYCGAAARVARAAGARRARLVVLRSVDPADWSTESAEDVVEHVLARAQRGDIVCLHDGVAPGNNGAPTRDATVTAVARLVPALLERRLRPVTVSELLG